MRRMNELTDAERTALLRAYAEGAGAKALAAEYQVSVGAVYGLAQRLEVPAPRHGPKSKHDSPELTSALEHYEREGGARDLAASLGLSPANLRRIASDRGYHAPSPSTGLGALTDSQRRALFRRYAEGEDAHALVAEFSLTSRAALHSAARTEGVRRPRPGSRGRWSLTPQRLDALARYAVFGDAPARAGECSMSQAAFCSMAHRLGVRAGVRASRPLTPEQITALERYAKEGDAASRAAECGMSNEQSFRGLASRHRVRSGRTRGKRTAVTA